MTLVEALRHHAELMRSPEVAPDARVILSDAAAVMTDAADELSALSEIKPTREAEYKRLLGEWLKKSEAHKPEIQEFKCGYQPFLERATRDFLAACERNEPEWP